MNLRHKRLDKNNELFYRILLLYNRARLTYRFEDCLGRVHHEAYISAAQHEKEDDARVQKANEHQERTVGSEKEESKGKKTPQRLITRIWVRMQSRRLKKNRQFRLVYSEGTREAGKRVILYVLRRECDGIVPGFVASRRIGKACQRNRAKRLMREIFRRLEDRIGEKHLWIVFVASFRPKECTFHEIFKDVESSMGRAGLIVTNG
jgi:ribonuclease P protein component